MSTRSLNSEAAVVAALIQSQHEIGAPMPRLVTQQPQVAMNAIKHQLTGQNIFMPPAELAAFLRIGIEMIEELEPCGIAETLTAQLIIESYWRLMRCSAIDINSFNTGVNDAANKILAASPNLSEDTAVANAQCHALNQGGLNRIEQFGRHMCRTQKALRLLREEYYEMHDRREKKRGNTFTAETSKLHAWYTKLAELTDKLLAEAEAKAAEAKLTPPAVPTEPATAPESTTSEPNLFCQKDLEMLREARLQGFFSQEQLQSLLQPAA